MNVVDTITKRLREAETSNTQGLVAHAHKLGDALFDKMCNAPTSEWRRELNGTWWYVWRIEVILDGQHAQFMPTNPTHEDNLHYDTHVAHLIAARVKARIADPTERAKVSAEFDGVTTGRMYIKISIITVLPVVPQ